MSDLTTSLSIATAFVGVGWLIAHAGTDYAEAIRHTLSVFALVIGMLVLVGAMGKLRAHLGVGRMMQRVEARSQIEPSPRQSKTSAMVNGLRR